MRYFKGKIEALNSPPFSVSTDQIVAGWTNIARRATEAIQRQCLEAPACVVALDGYPGTDWVAAVNAFQKDLLAANFSTIFINLESCQKSESALDTQLAPFLGEDPVFGRIYPHDLKTLFDGEKLKQVRNQIRRIKKNTLDSRQHIIICYGTGAVQKPLLAEFNLIFYLDLTREEVLKRVKSWQQIRGKTQSISPKKLYYVDFPANDRHRNVVLACADFYIDGNQPDQPLLLPVNLLKHICECTADGPFRLKPIYEPGPWGGQWLKQVRGLPSDWVNCAWSYEVIAQEMSLLVQVDDKILELPWNTFFNHTYAQIMGDLPRRRFGGEFPIRYDYLDTVQGGDLSIQVHPTTVYIRKHFGEPYHQGEMYYIVAAREGTTVNLGLNANIDPAAFHEAAKRADEQAIPFHYPDFVNQVPSAKHDLLLIPPGTVHGSGEGQVVLEISATTYRYTFKLYDHLRPDLSGVMRPIHVAHGFNVIKWFRRGKWVTKNLKPAPVLIRSGNDWTEYLIGDRPEFFHVVFRQEFQREISDDTRGNFHILTLVEGEVVRVEAETGRQYEFCFSETIIIPASLGKYRVINPGMTPCKIVKARLR